MKHWINQNATIGFAASQKAAEALFGSAWKADPRWHLLYCGVDLKPFRTPVQPLAIRTELGIPTDAIVVGHVGRFWEQKNHTFLIDILVELAKREPKVRLLLVGEGPLRSVIEQRVVQARVADKVIFAGARPDVPQLMLGAMDVFVFPSLYEGLGLVGIEAQAAGLPFVLSDTIPEEISVVPSLIRRLSLSQPAREWAETILSINRKRPSSSQEYALSLIEKTPYNIDYNVKLLESMYAN
jgi:glycosyltransferase involved in cell wall biosynthesis